MRKKLTTILILGMALFLSSCTKTETVEKSESDRNLLLAVLSYSEAQSLKANEIDIKGYWFTGFYAVGKFTASGNLIVSTNPDGTGTWSTTSSGSFGIDRVDRIVQFDNSKRQLFYQQGQGNSNNYLPFGTDNRAKFGRLDWTTVSTQGCEEGASKCFFYCERVNGKASLSEAISDSSTSDSSDPKTKGCGAFPWNQANFRTANPDWK